MEELKVDIRDMGALFKVCPKCGYERGFHSIFRSRPRQTKEYDWLFICPKCGATYEVGLSVTVQRKVLPSMQGPQQKASRGLK